MASNHGARLTRTAPLSLPRVTHHTGSRACHTDAEPALRRAEQPHVLKLPARQLFLHTPLAAMEPSMDYDVVKVDAKDVVIRRESSRPEEDYEVPFVLPPPADTRSVVDKYFSFQGSLGYNTGVFLNFVTASAVLGLVTMVGGFVFSGLEVKTANDLNSQYITFINALQAQLTNQSVAGNVTTGAALYNTLVGNYVTPASGVTNSWDFHAFSAFLFSFELITTIGYGEIAPKTVGGRLWACIFSFLFIPTCAICLTAISGVIITFLETFYVMFDNNLHDAWAACSPQGGFRGAALPNVKLSLEHVRRRLYEEDEFEEELETAKVTKHLKQPGDRVGFLQFVRLYMGQQDEATQRRHKYRSLYISSFLVIVWHIMGMFVFNALEQWGLMASFYFCFITLSTIGLGDFYPSTQQGENFHFFFCVTGLGLTAVLLNSIADIVGSSGGDPNPRHEGVIDAIRYVEFLQEAANKSAGVVDAGPPQKITPKREPGSAVTPADMKLAAAKMSLQDMIGSTKARDRQRVLIQLLNACSSEAWFIPTVKQYIPPTNGATNGNAPVVKVFARPPAAAASGAATIPPFRPTFTQLYDDEPGTNLSGAPRDGYPVYPERFGATGRALFDRSAGRVGHGPFPEEPGTLVGAAAVAAAAAARDAAQQDATADDHLAWNDPRSKGSGMRDPATERFRDTRNDNRL